MIVDAHQDSREFPPRLRCNDDLLDTTTRRYDDDPLLVATPTMVRGLCQGPLVQAVLGPRPDRQRATTASVTVLAHRRDSQRSRLREQQLQRRGPKVGADPSNRTRPPLRYQWPREWLHTRCLAPGRRRPLVGLATSQGRVRIIIIINSLFPRVCRWQRRLVPFPPYRQLKVRQDLNGPLHGGQRVSAPTRRDPPLRAVPKRSRFLRGTLANRSARRT